MKRRRDRKGRAGEREGERDFENDTIKKRNKRK